MGVHTLMPWHRREAITAEIEAHLQRVELLIARLDRADAPFEDLEDSFDQEATNEDGEVAVLRESPLYGVDQTAGLINYREAGRAYNRAQLR